MAIACGTRFFTQEFFISDVLFKWTKYGYFFQFLVFPGESRKDLLPVAGHWFPVSGYVLFVSCIMFPILAYALAFILIQIGFYLQPVVSCFVFIAGNERMV
jgi:hypothetical protein